MRSRRLGPVLPSRRRARLVRPALPVLSLAAGLLGGLGATELALGAIPVGSEFQVNTYTTSFQGSPDVAVGAAGDLVIVWFGPEIQAQRYDASGTAVGSEFQVNTYTSGNASVAADADGGFVVVWYSYGSPGSDTSLGSIQCQRYDASGNALGSQFQVNTYTTSYQWDPSVAVDADGDFVVVWTSDGSAGNDSWFESVQGQRYDASGNALGSQFQVNTYTPQRQRLPSVAVDAGGDFVVVWHSYGSAGSDTSGASIQGQRYDASGNALGSEFQVNTYTTDDQWFPDVAVDADGDFVVVWGSGGELGKDTSRFVQGQRYDASGNALGSEFQINTYVAEYQHHFSVATNADGDFGVAWESDGSAGSDTSDYSIQARLYEASGNALGSQFQVNTYTTDDQRFPSVALDACGELVVVWESDGSAGSDTSDQSVQGQRYATPVIPALGPTALMALAALLLGAGTLRLRGRFRQRA